MSHFSVLILGENIEVKLAPYDENLEVSPYIWQAKAELEKELAEIDQEGNTITTYNPNSKWDYYSIGGRWRGCLTSRAGVHTDQARLDTLDPTKHFTTYAVITEDGEWHAKGEMSWFAFSTETEEEAEEWKKQYWSRFIESLSGDTLLTMVDCHI